MTTQPLSPNKIVLAYSGGLDTSVILKWLQNEYDCEVVTYTADLGQDEDLSSIKKKAEKLGIRQVVLEDLSEEFARDYIFPMFRCNAIYEGEYLLGTSIARPLIAKRLIETAKKTNADAIAHGSTGKGNDQIRFELGAYALNPDIKIIAPWRTWDFKSRHDLIDYAEKNEIPLSEGSKNEPPYSTDANLLHISYEGGILEDPWISPPEDMWKWIKSPENAPANPTDIIIDFEAGNPISVNGKELSPAEIIRKLNHIGSMNGVGRLDIVENRYVGIKSRGCYETPGGTILLKAHRAIESVTLDREVAHYKDRLIPKYAELIYNGFWWSPERMLLQKTIDETQKNVSGAVKLSVYKGNVTVTGRKSKDKTLYNMDLATFEEDRGAYNPQDAEGFISINALRLKVDDTKY